DVFRTLATETLADRVHNPGLEPARADVIVGGCCILVALFRTLGLREILVSEADILDGLIPSLASRRPPLGPRPRGRGAVSRGGGAKGRGRDDDPHRPPRCAPTARGRGLPGLAGGAATQRRLAPQVGAAPTRPRTRPGGEPRRLRRAVRRPAAGAAAGHRLR